MSDMYEGVIFCSDEPAARTAFTGVTSSLRLRLVRLADGVFGVYRVTGRTDAFDQAAVEQVAKQMSFQVGCAIAIFYDNSCGIRACVLYESGRRDREFGDDDAWWVPYGTDGNLASDGPRFRVNELRPDKDYDCVFSAIDAGLEAVEARRSVDAKLVKQAFRYEELGWLAESAG